MPPIVTHSLARCLEEAAGVFADEPASGVFSADAFGVAAALGCSCLGLAAFGVACVLTKSAEVPPSTAAACSESVFSEEFASGVFSADAFGVAERFGILHTAASCAFCFCCAQILRLFVCLAALAHAASFPFAAVAPREREGGTKRFTSTISVQCTNRDWVRELHDFQSRVRLEPNISSYSQTTPSIGTYGNGNAKTGKSRHAATNM
jgi:hypothetical protein